MLFLPSSLCLGLGARACANCCVQKLSTKATDAGCSKMPCATRGHTEPTTYLLVPTHLEGGLAGPEQFIEHLTRKEVSLEKLRPASIPASKRGWPSIGNKSWGAACACALAAPAVTTPESPGGWPGT